MSKVVKVPSNYYSIMKWAGIIIIIGGIKATSSLILPFLLAIFISLMLYQPVRWLESKKVPKAISIILVLIVFGTSIFLIGDLLGHSIHQFSEGIPEYKEKLLSYSDTNAEKIDAFGIDFSEYNLFGGEPGKMMDFVFSGLNQAKQVIGKLFFILLLTLFLLFDLDSFPYKFDAIFSRKENKKAKLNLNKIVSNLRHYLGIKTLTSLATGFLIYIGLTIIGVEYAILWSIIAYLLNYIPNVGSLIAAIPAVLFAGLELGGDALLWTGLLYLGVNLIIGSLIEPKIMGNGMGLSTSVILLSLMFWGWLFGPIGMFLSVPLTMVLKIFTESNDGSKYFAILIGTKDDAIKITEDENKKNANKNRDVKNEDT